MAVFEAISGWFERVDPGTHRRVKGLRLVTAFGLAAMMGTLHAVASGVANGGTLSFLAGGFALWASVSEARIQRRDSTRDLLLLCLAAGIGAVVMLSFAAELTGPGRPGSEIILASGAFCVGYLKRFGVLGAGIGSQIFIGQLLAYGAGLTHADFGTVVVAVAIAAVAAVVPRLLSGPAEHPAAAQEAPAIARGPLRSPAELVMGCQAAVATLVIVALDDRFGLEEASWAITACTYVIASTTSGTLDRVRRRIFGTLIGVPLGIACLPLAIDAPLLVWSAAAIAMIIYAMALPNRYDVACGAYAFTLVVTLAAAGEHSTWLFAARIWETVVGGGLGLAAALILLPLHAPKSPG
ncbi:Fusaric acid resistance protein-like [Kaistia soli DSM 19436]|uniref:Fusaric acid resistance protein-like n=1 Tax=Kaistia soli DSM 19436 TaxID=1122133 RepID=A0A1M4ZQE9_9HYPH|nr:FUSC family protein [Kaistia soli]SHF20269.1 Fusaric acid resistance protein-like [Kaistia soli DSM 19436]